MWTKKTGAAHSSSCASLRSVFCFLTRAAWISAGSPIHTSKPNSASSRSNQRGISGGLHSHLHVHSSQPQVSIELLGLPIAVIQSSFAVLASLFHQKCDLLKARVIIYAYQHVRLLPPEPLVVKQLEFTRVEEPTLLCNQVPRLFPAIKPERRPLG